MSRFGNLGHRLYVGDVSFDFVGRRKLWLALSGVILLLAVVGLSVRGLNLGIEFKGGEIYTISKPGVTISQAQDAANALTNSSNTIVQSVDSTTGGKQVTVQINSSANVNVVDARNVLGTKLGENPQDITTQVIGASWGKEISQKALEGLIVFLILVTLYLAFAFEWRLAVGALTALLHDLVITIGIYALLGFTVSSGTVIGFLTILGYSLYDLSLIHI